MLKNYFKTTLRSLRKNKLFSLINIFGLSIGIAATTFILQYAFFELNFDKFHTNSSSIYRVMNERFEGDQLIQRGQITYSAVGPQMKEDYPEIVNATTIELYSQSAVRYKDVTHLLPSLLLIEPSFFDMFSYEILFGNPDNMVSDPNSLVLTESMAKVVLQEAEGDWSKHIGQTISLGSSQRQLLLTGIVADPPENSSLQFEAILSRSTYFEVNPNAKFSWNSSDYFHYVELAPGVDFKTLEEKFAAFSQKHFKGTEITGTFEKFHLQPLEDVYLYSDYEYENHGTSNGSMVWTLILIAAFILIMAWINYINLTTSKSLQRAKEVGVRKVVGASKNQLVSQFLIESLILNVLALVLAVTLVQLFQGFFNQLVERDLSLVEFLSSQLGSTTVFVWLIAILLTGSLLSGIYPAFVLSSFQASESIKGEFGKGSKGQLLRKTLVVFQFSLSIALIAGTVLVYQQTNFMRNQDLGVNMDRVMTVEAPSITRFDSTFVERMHQFMNKLEQNARIEKVGSSRAVFGDRLPRTFNVRTSAEGEGHMLNRIQANYGFLDVYEVEIVAGRNFVRSDHNGDFNLVRGTMLNEKGARILGFNTPQEAINKKISYFGREWEVIGITADFHHRSLRSTIEPLMIVPFMSGGDDTYHLRVDGSNLTQTIDYVAKTFDEFYPDDIFDYGFMDARFDNQYASDRQFGKIFNLFSILAIAIACLGLFGLAGYTAIQKTKEIGIRKVLGASMNNILGILSKEFFLLILLSSVIGLPLIYFGAKQWLMAYEYQTSIGLLFFLLPVLIVLFVAVTIIVGQSLKVVQANPIKSLRQD